MGGGIVLNDRITWLGSLHPITESQDCLLLELGELWCNRVTINRFYKYHTVSDQTPKGKKI